MIIIITGPSGVGKNTIINELSNHINFYFSTSFTTRPRRDNEKEGEDYYFISNQEFNNLIDNNEMLEYEEYGGYLYGTPNSEITRDGIVILDLEVNGATKLLKSNNDYIGIFIDINDDELIKRLVSRGHDQEFINKRMILANSQREHKGEYDYYIENQNLNTAVNNIIDIICKLEEQW